MGRATRWFRSLLGGNKAAEERPAAKRKKGWGFVKTFQKDRQLPAKVVVSGDEQRMRAIAVAAATAVAAEAAVEAAEAAAAVVRLTTSGWPLTMEERAAVKVQAAFRGYLARRALRALKGLVKLQALVRGNIVRKQAAETLRCMKALVRVQTRARAFRALHFEQSRPSKSCHHSYNGPATPENYEAAIRSMASKWMEEPYLSRREASKSMDDAKNAKTFELENEKSRFYSRRGSSLYHLQSDHSVGSVATAPDSLSKESNTPTHLSTPSPSPFDGHQYTSQPLRFPAVESGDSPRLYSTVSQSGSSRRGPFTPAKSEFSRSLFEGYPNHPNYMAKTESSIAKLRSRSAPRQRPECEKTNSMRRLTAQELGQQSSRSSKLQGKGYPGSGRLDRLGMPMAM